MKVYPGPGAAGIMQRPGFAFACGGIGEPGAAG